MPLFKWVKPFKKGDSFRISLYVIPKKYFQPNFSFFTQWPLLISVTPKKAKVLLLFHEQNICQYIERDNRLFVKIQINLEHPVVVQDSEWGSDSIMVHACN